MTARQFAKSVDHTVAGKLTRKMGRYVAVDGTVEHWQYWIDEAGNEYAKDKNGWFIVTADGGVI